MDHALAINGGATNAFFNNGQILLTAGRQLQLGIALTNNGSINLSGALVTGVGGTVRNAGPGVQKWRPTAAADRQTGTSSAK